LNIKTHGEPAWARREFLVEAMELKADLGSFSPILFKVSSICSPNCFYIILFFFVHSSIIENR